MTASEDFIGYWAEIYHATRLSEEGVPFEAFIQAPHEHLGAYGQSEAPESMRQGYEPLLPAQARVARRLRAHEARASAPAPLSELKAGSARRPLPASEYV